MVSTYLLYAALLTGRLDKKTGRPELERAGPTGADGLSRAGGNKTPSCGRREAMAVWYMASPSPP